MATPTTTANTSTLSLNQQQQQQQQKEAAAQVSHPLSLKVMRLSRPSLHVSAPIPLDVDNHNISAVLAKSLQHNQLHIKPEIIEPDILGLADTSKLNIRDFGLSEFLSLPPSFGNIYLGETFSSYLCINNESHQSVHETGLKAELQTASQRLTLADTVSASSEFQTSLLPSQPAEFLIHHEIKELGIHILVCSVHYTLGSERRFFRKFYKFQVLNPLAVKTKVNTLPNGTVFLEAQVQNVAGIPMCLDRLVFEPSQLFDFTDMTLIPDDTTTAANKENIVSKSRSTAPATPTPKSVFGESNQLCPHDTRQYLYMLKPKSPNDPINRTTPTLGKLDIVWRTQFGQLGRLQTSQLSRKVVPLESYDLIVLELPKEGSIVAERPFALTCQVRNNLATDTICITVSGIKNRMSSILIWGQSEMSLGEIPPLGTKEFKLEVFPLLAGLHKVTGLRLTESNLGAGSVKDIDVLTDVFVNLK